MIKVFLPYKTRKLFDLPVEIDAEGNNLRNLIEFLDIKYPGLNSAPILINLRLSDCFEFNQHEKLTAFLR